MNAVTYVAAVFKAAGKCGLRIDRDQLGRLRICFNGRSKKFLHQGHIEALFPGILREGLSISEMNAMIEAVAPGRPCTHVGMRRIIEMIR